MKVGNVVAIAALLAAAPLAAQTVNEAAPPTTSPAPAPATPPATDAVGPPQLRDFTLPGTVTEPARPTLPAADPPAPATRTPAPATATLRASADPAPAAPRRDVPAVQPPTAAAPDGSAVPDVGSPDLPQPTTEPTARVPIDAVPDPVALPGPTESETTPWWPWLAALLAVILGGGLLWWRRQQRDDARYAADHADVGALVETPAPPAALPRAAATPPRPAPQPRPDPQPRPLGQAAPPARPVLPTAPATPAPQPSPRLVPTPTAAAPRAPAPAAALGIVASRLKPELALELIPLRAETDAREGAALTFDVIVHNQGSAAARDVLIETRLINAGPRVNAEVGAFFQQPAGSGERIPVIAPLQQVAVRLRLAAPGGEIAPIVVEGRKLLVPVVAVNAQYRWSGGENTESASFLVGRGDSEGGKMAPFRLDQGARSWSGLGARLHSSGLQR